VGRPVVVAGPDPRPDWAAARAGPRDCDQASGRWARRPRRDTMRLRPAGRISGLAWL